MTGIAIRLRKIENAHYGIIPIFVEAGFFEREKAGIYQLRNQLKPLSDISSYIYKKSYKVNSPVTLDYMVDPYFGYLGIGKN